MLLCYQVRPGNSEIQSTGCSPDHERIHRANEEEQKHSVESDRSGAKNNPLSSSSVFEDPLGHCRLYLLGEVEGGGLVARREERTMREGSLLVNPGIVVGGLFATEETGQDLMRIRVARIVDSQLGLSGTQP
jgi:hypothetical protein